MLHQPPPTPTPQYCVIGLVGRAGVGKDTCAAILAETRGFTCLAFADALREEAIAAFAVDPHIFADRALKEMPSAHLRIHNCRDNRFIRRAEQLGLDTWTRRSPREIMRLWGTEYRRFLDGDTYWLERTNDRIHALMCNGSVRICLTDVRYPNEAAYVTASLSGRLWRIRRKGPDAVEATHSSEADVSLIQCGVTIHNDLGLAELAQEAHAALGRQATE